MKKPGPVASESRKRGGGSIPGGAPGQAAFSLTLRNPSPVPVLLAVPHSGRLYPDALIEAMREPAVAAPRLEDRFVDLLAEAVARDTGAGLLVAHAPRAMIDLNRAADDIDWDMVAGAAPGRSARQAAGRRARSGLGLVPRRLPGLGEVWRRRMTRAELAERIDAVHKPYHAALAAALETLRDRWGAALLVDLHSMPPLRPRFPGDRPAEFVIGDRFGASCDPALSAQGFAYLARHERRAAHNRPYAGGYILDRHAAPARSIHAMQVEICRATYLDAQFAEPSARMAAMARLLTGLVRELGDVVATLGRGGSLPLAAE